LPQLYISNSPHSVGHALAQPQDSNAQVAFKLKASGSMEPPQPGDGSGTDASDDEEEAKQTNGPKQEIRYIWGCLGIILIY